MKKIIIILGLIFGLTKLTASEKEAINSDYLKTDQLMNALEQLSVTSALGKAALMVSAAAVAATAAYGIYYYLSPAPNGINYAGFYTYRPAGQKVHSPRIGINTPITLLKLTITLQRNGWLGPVTINIEEVTDANGYNSFLAGLQRNLTNEEKVITGEAAVGNVALLQQNQTYAFTISGNVTYQNTNRLYELQEEQVITMQTGDRDNWIRSFWDKNIATRVASVWPVLPGNLINDNITTYHAVITDTNTKQQLHSLSVAHKENFKNQLIQALASEIFANTIKRVEIKISATMQKDHFALAPLTLSINAPGCQAPIYEGLKRPFIIPAWALAPGQLTQEAARINYATQLWTDNYATALNQITSIQPLTLNQKLKTVMAWAAIAVVAGYGIKELDDTHLLSPAVFTFLGFATLTKMHNMHTAHKAKYH